MDHGARRKVSRCPRRPPCSHRTKPDREDGCAPTEHLPRHWKLGAPQTPSFPGLLSGSPGKLLHRQSPRFLAYSTHSIKSIEPGCSKRPADQLPCRSYCQPQLCRLSGRLINLLVSFLPPFLMQRQAWRAMSHNQTVPGNKWESFETWNRRSKDSGQLAGVPANLPLLLTGPVSR